METRYSLFGFIIVERENYLGWIQHVGDFNDTGEMMYLTGRAYIHETHDVLLLGKSKTLERDEEHPSFDEVEKYMDSLLKWDKTRYYVKLADLKLDSLLLCESGDVVYSDINQSILQSLITGENT
jgi:hypothetical protein